MINFLWRGIHWAFPLFFLAVLAFGEHSDPSPREGSERSVISVDSSPDLMNEFSLDVPTSVGEELVQGLSDVSSAATGRASPDLVGEQPTQD